MFDDINKVDFVQNKIIENVGFINKNSNCWQFKCPICGDSLKKSSKTRGTYYIKTNSYFCFNGGCDANEGNTNVFYMLAQLENTTVDDIKRQYICFLATNNSLSGSNYIDILKEDNKHNKSEFVQKRDWETLNNTTKKQLENRHIFDAPYKPKNWKMYHDMETDRLVIPWGEEYYQLRALNKNQQPKYLFPPNTEKNIFNYDNIKEELEYVFLLEGVFDSIFVENGVAIGSVHLTNNQSKLLDKKLVTPVYLFDNQWVDDASYKTSLKLAKKGKKIFIWEYHIKEKDINEYIINNKKNIFTYDYICKHIYTGLKAYTKLKFRQ